VKKEAGGVRWVYQLPEKQRLKVARRLNQVRGLDNLYNGLSNGLVAPEDTRKADRVADNGDGPRVKKRKVDEPKTKEPKANKSKASKESKAKKPKTDKEPKAKKSKAIKEPKAKKVKVDKSNPNWRLKPNPTITVWEKVRNICYICICTYCTWFAHLTCYKWIHSEYVCIVHVSTV
jgi:hypothetical protein